GLGVMPLELLPPLLHLHQQAGTPEQIGEFGALARPLHPVFQRGTGFLVAAVAERLEQPVAEDLGLALLVAPQPASIGDELADPFRRGPHPPLAIVTSVD